MRVRLPGGCQFDALPRCFPTTDITLHYSLRFERRFAYGDGGVLPCVWPACDVRWTSDGRLALWQRGRPGCAITEPLELRGRGAWNDVVVRVRVGAGDTVTGTASAVTGTASLSVNGRVSTSPWRPPAGSVVRGLSCCVRGFRSAGEIDLADFWLV